MDLSEFYSFNFDEDESPDPSEHGLRHDYMSQLFAIRMLLMRQDNSDAQLVSEIERIDEVARSSEGARNDRAVDQYVELAHDSVFQSAAHSMAAVGMLAPLLESIFNELFEQFGGKKPKGQLVRNIVAMIDDESVDLRRFMPTDLDQTLEALFLYRNKMFHYGLEWPSHQREQFAGCLEDWPEGWFSLSTTNNVPWMFYMTPEFIDHCLDMVESIFLGLCRYQRGPGRDSWKYPSDAD